MLVIFTGWRALHAATTVRHLLKWPRSGVGRVLCPAFVAAAVSSTMPRVPIIQEITKKLPGYWPSSVPAILGR